MTERPQLGSPGSFTDLAFDAGVIWSQAQLVQWLFDKSVVRDSMLGKDWLVIYTQDGPIDIRREVLERTK